MFKRKEFIVGLFLVFSNLFLVFGLSQSVILAQEECPPSIPTITEEVQFPPGWLLQWAPNNPEEMDQNSSVAISVIGGTPPYLWLVSGNGFSLSLSQTSGSSNILTANGACGTATITVSDFEGRVISGYVRNTGCGEWVLIQEYCCRNGITKPCGGPPNTTWTDIGLEALNVFGKYAYLPGLSFIWNSPCPLSDYPYQYLCYENIDDYRNGNIIPCSESIPDLWYDDYLYFTGYMVFEWK